MTAGILYGAYHHNRLSKKEVINRKIEAEKKVIRDAQLAIEKKKRYEGINNKILSLICGVDHYYFINISEEVRALEELSRPTKQITA